MKLTRKSSFILLDAGLVVLGLDGRVWTMDEHFLAAGPTPPGRGFREWLEKGRAARGGMNPCTGLQTVTKSMRAEVVVGGFISPAMVENHDHRGLEVTLPGAAIREREGPGKHRRRGRRESSPGRKTCRLPGSPRWEFPVRCRQPAGTGLRGCAGRGQLRCDRDTFVIGSPGGGACFATRLLLRNGLKAREIPGGMLCRSHPRGA